MALSDHPITFASAGVSEFQSVGRFLRVRKATSPVYISVDGSGEIEREQGEQIDLGIKGEGKRVRVRSVVAQSVMITTASDRQDDNRTSVSMTVAATVEAGNDNQHLTKTTVAAGMSAQIAAANASRKALRVALLSDAAGYVTLGKSGVTATSGGPIEPGVVDYIDTEGALWAFNPNAVAVDVWCMEVNRL